MLLGILFALLAAIGWGTSAIFVRLGLQRMRSSTGTVVSLAAGVLMIGTIALIVYGSEMFALPAVAFAWFALLGLLNYPLGRFLNFTAVSLAGISRASPILAAAPLVAVTWSVLLGGETLTPLIALGGATIVGGVVLIVSERAA